MAGTGEEGKEKTHEAGLVKRGESVAHRASEAFAAQSDGAETTWRAERGPQTRNSRFGNPTTPPPSPCTLLPSEKGEHSQQRRCVVRTLRTTDSA
jgi:hypothetical protein